MNNEMSEKRNVLWFDPVMPLVEAERACLRQAGISVLEVYSLIDLRRALGKGWAVVVRLEAGGALLAEVQTLMRGMRSGIPLVCRVDRHHLEMGVQAMHQGAAHVLSADDWSVQSWSAVFGLLAAPEEQQNFIFVDPASQKLLELAERVAQAGVTTLLTGPTGAGKEVLARVLHDASPRRDGPFIGLNCAAMPESMIEDLLFGHEKGAFTGAVREHLGVFEQANGGSLFLDEIGEMPIQLQSKLLRVLQERQVTRLGALGHVAVDVRLIVASNKDLRAAIQAREFREDLYFRISTFKLRVPALSERRQDILPLARHMLNVHACPSQDWVISDEAETLLVEYAWPGNVRELSNVIQRALVLSRGPLIGAEHLIFEDQSDTDRSGVSFLPPAQGLPVRDAGSVDKLGLDAAVRSSEHRAISAALSGAANRLEAAKLLGISPRTLRYKLAQLRDHGLSVSHGK